MTSKAKMTQTYEETIAARIYLELGITSTIGFTFLSGFSFEITAAIVSAIISLSVLCDLILSNISLFAQKLHENLFESLWLDTLTDRTALTNAASRYEETGKIHFDYDVATNEAISDIQTYHKAEKLSDLLDKPSWPTVYRLFLSIFYVFVAIIITMIRVSAGLLMAYIWRAFH